jgi:hypothetical protein
MAATCCPAPSCRPRSLRMRPKWQPRCNSSYRSSACPIASCSCYDEGPAPPPRTAMDRRGIIAASPTSSATPINSPWLTSILKMSREDARQLIS